MCSGTHPEGAPEGSPLLSPSPGSILSRFEKSLGGTSLGFPCQQGTCQGSSAEHRGVEGQEEGKRRFHTGRAEPGSHRDLPTSEREVGPCPTILTPAQSPWGTHLASPRAEWTLPEPAFPCFSHVISAGEAGNYRGAGAELAAGQSESSASLISGTGMSDSGTRSWFQSRCGSVSTMQGRAKSVSRE